MRLPLRRIGAWLIDCVCILGWAGVVAAVGVPLYRAGVTRRQSTLELNLISALVLVVPVVVAAAIAESRGGAGTPGKRALGLTVRSATGKPWFRTALARNALKIGVPWLIGHAAVFALTTGDRSRPVPPGLWVLTAAAYALPIVYVASLCVGDGRTPYDRISGTRVIWRRALGTPTRST